MSPLEVGGDSSKFYFKRLGSQIFQNISSSRVSNQMIFFSKGINVLTNLSDPGIYTHWPHSKGESVDFARDRLTVLSKIVFLVMLI